MKDQVYTIYNINEKCEENIVFDFKITCGGIGEENLINVLSQYQSKTVIGL